MPAHRTTSADRKPKSLSGSTSENVRLMSVKRLGEILGVSRPTIDTWISTGCPVARKSPVAGIAHELDIAEVVAWLQTQAARQAVEGAEKEMSKRFASITGRSGETTEEADRRRAIADANIAELKEARELGAVVLREEVLRVVAEEYAAVKEDLLTLPNNFAGQTSGVTDPNKKAAIAMKLVMSACAKLKGEI